MVRKFLYWSIGLLFRVFTRLEVVGLENLPPTGGLIVAVNHLNILDPPLVFAMLPRQDATALAADKHKKNPFLRWIVEAVDGIWINREGSDLHALRQAQAHLQGGGLLGIAPEGTRSPTGALIRAKTGVAFLADRTGAPVVPAAVTGTETALRQLMRLRRPAVRIEFGELFRLPPVERKKRDADLQRNTDEIMCRIAAMLPEKYRGAYAEHPRLKEILAGEEERVFR